jgi:hypothetical protein
MSEKPFDASRHLSKLNGKDYLEVKWRLLWLRSEHPEAAVSTELVKHESSLALFRAHVSLPEGGEAAGWGSETANDVPHHIEAAETKSLGRALAALGYGTQFCDDFDLPREAPAGATAAAQPASGHPARRGPPRLGSRPSTPSAAAERT